MSAPEKRTVYFQGGEAVSADVRLDDPRLDRNTLLFAAGMFKGAHERIGGQRSARVLQGLHDRLIAEVARRDKEAASRPPALSDWIRACEGTGLGEPGICGESLDCMLGLYFDVDGFGGRDPASHERDETPAIEVQIDTAVAGCSDGVARVYLARDDGALHARCATPAELRSALERLAAEAGR